MSEYVLGLVTLPALIIGVAGAAGVVYFLWGAAQKLNASVHEKLTQKVELQENLLRPYEKDERPLYESSANTIRDALLSSPKLYLVTALGWHLMLVRSHTEVAPIRREDDAGYIDTEEFLSGTAGNESSGDAER